MERCEALRPTDPTGHYPCALAMGHRYDHMDRDNDTWRNMEEQPTLTELATSLGRIMERLNVVEENADRVVKIAENLRVRVPSGGQDRLAVAALNHHLGKLTTLLSERLPEPPSPRCGELSPGSGTDRCESPEGHIGRHMNGTSSWPQQAPERVQKCPARMQATDSSGNASTTTCDLPEGHQLSRHHDPYGFHWTTSGI